jgi:hypothetical protein
MLLDFRPGRSSGTRLSRFLPDSAGAWTDLTVHTLTSEGHPEWKLQWENERGGARVEAGKDRCIFYPYPQAHRPTVLAINRT